MGGGLAFALQTADCTPWMTWSWSSQSVEFCASRLAFLSPISHSGAAARWRAGTASCECVCVCVCVCVHSRSRSRSPSLSCRFDLFVCQCVVRSALHPNVSCICLVKLASCVEPGIIVHRAFGHL